MVPTRELKKSGNDFKLAPDMFEPTVMFPPNLRRQDFELSPFSSDLPPDPVGPVLQVAANVTHFFVFGLRHGAAPPQAHHGATVEPAGGTRGPIGGCSVP